MRHAYYIGLMSGTSLDGVDGVLASIGTSAGNCLISTVAACYVPFPKPLQRELLALQTPGCDEIHREAVTANTLTELYADCVRELLLLGGASAQQVGAVGAHGQTIRHRPDLRYTWQTINAALLAERTGIDVVSDFRSRDVAAGGQGAPLVPAFHRAVFADAAQTRVILNLGGMANISILEPEGNVYGYDTGPGNVLLDAWIMRQRGAAFDAKGQWAASGVVIPELLAKFLAEPYFAMPAPKNTGRDLFDAAWLDRHLQGASGYQPQDVQATLCALTASTVADAVAETAPSASALFVCGGGAYNTHPVNEITSCLRQRGCRADVECTSTLGILPQHVEALAFAWLAQCFANRAPANIPAVTGARERRILGALYPA